MELVHHFLDFMLLPNFAGHFVMQGPNDAGNARDLLDVAELDLVVAFAVQTETHVHRHIYFLQLFVILVAPHRDEQCMGPL
jgi:hypothetical protein